MMMIMCRGLAAGALVAALGSCSETKSPSVATTPATTPSPAPSGAPVCPTQKLAFTQEHACDNDGSVEFCLEATDTAAQNAVRALAPDVQFQPGSRGRARCSASQTLTLIPLNERDCPAHHGPASNEAWSRLCALAALGQVREIVATWYE
ncbi:hypothetical protein LZC95_39935 [Pendulispora brunnea]|uniref:Lipoprotein n=1 Tax=Pendulispora brunnea TaxID=2905690 RepID=A0ABZ2K4W7_9BACT